MRRKGIDKDIVVLLISTLITLASWVGFEVYRAYVKTIITPDVEQSLQPIDPTLKKDVFVTLKGLENEEP